MRVPCLSDVVIGGGNVHKLEQLPPDCRASNETNAFTGGFRLWTKPDRRQRRSNP